MHSLTKKQQQVLRFISAFIKAQGMPPTRAEIAHSLGVRSVNTAEDYVRILSKKGAIEILRGASRGIKLCAPTLASRSQGIPIIAKVAAGAPIVVEPHIDGYCNIDPHFFHPTADYMLLVSGMSMRDVGILDGDLVAVHKTQHSEQTPVSIEGIQVGVIRR